MTFVVDGREVLVEGVLVGWVDGAVFVAVVLAAATVEGLLAAEAPEGRVAAPLLAGCVLVFAGVSSPCAPTFLMALLGVPPLAGATLPVLPLPLDELPLKELPVPVVPAARLS